MKKIKQSFRNSIKKNNLNVATLIWTSLCMSKNI